MTGADRVVRSDAQSRLPIKALPLAPPVLDGYPLAPMRVLPTRLAGLTAIELVSERDSGAPLLREVAGELPFQWHP